VTVAATVGAIALFAADVPEPDRAAAWLACLVPAALGLTWGPVSRWLEVRAASTGVAGLMSARGFQIGVIVVAVVFAALTSRTFDARTIMLIEAGGGAVVLSLLVAYRGPW
jgi:hypothetical protein